MPLSAPVGGAVDLIQELIITVPPTNSRVQFSPLDINSDKAYRLEFDLVLNSAADPVRWPNAITPLTNLNIFDSISSSFEQVQCSLGCPAGSHAIPATSVAVYGTITWRRILGNGFVCGVLNYTNFDNLTTIEEVSFGSHLFRIASPNVTAVGLELSQNPSGGIDTGSVFRLYKGSG